MNLLTWLLHGRERHTHVQPWTPVIAAKHELATARMLLGAAGPARVVGNRRREAFWADVSGNACAARVAAKVAGTAVPDKNPKVLPFHEVLEDSSDEQ